MLTREENDLLTRTGAGTPMGLLMRRYWIPALFAYQLPGPDCPPLRVRLLGEDLVAFRDSTGRVGLLDAHCPHRGASLFFGRNEECGLRCVYHGWKFDVEGNCVDMPNEPAESSFKHKIKQTAYPCEERGSVIWTYMGPSALQPEFPELEWTLVPGSQRFATRHLQECNWFQALEGGFDTSHVPFLHGGDTANRTGGIRLNVLATQFETVPMDFGFISGSGRPQDDGSSQWTASVLLMPFHKLISRFAGNDAPIGAHAWVPVDDENCMNWSIEYHPHRPLRDDEMERSRNYLYIHAQNLPGSDRPVANKDNDYLIDRELQKSGKSFTGIKGIGLQDCGIQESMGAISDRTVEHLGTSDMAIITLRRMLLHALRDVGNGSQPPGLDPASYRVRSTGMTVPPGASFQEMVGDYVRIRPPSVTAKEDRTLVKSSTAK